MVQTHQKSLFCQVYRIPSQTKQKLGEGIFVGFVWDCAAYGHSLRHNQWLENLKNLSIASTNSKEPNKNSFVMFRGGSYTKEHIWTEMWTSLYQSLVATQTLKVVHLHTKNDRTDARNELWWMINLPRICIMHHNSQWCTVV